ncbi:MAG TPA: hypothetical protein VFG43_03910 [Geminicoccaceae bacterium]|nr:hypothetical protein [Geminicoccaceae bacterium]
MIAAIEAGAGIGYELTVSALVVAGTLVIGALLDGRGSTSYRAASSKLSA